MAFCEHCGKELQDGQMFCPACGKPVNQEHSEPQTELQIKPQTEQQTEPKTESKTEPQTEHQQEEKKTFSTKRKFIVLLSVVIVAALAGVAVFLVTKHNEREIAESANLTKEAQKYIQDSDYEKAVSPLKSAIKKDPKNMVAYSSLAKAYSGQGDQKNADKIYEDAMTTLAKSKNKALPKYSGKVAYDALMHAISRRDLEATQNYMNIITELTSQKSKDEKEDAEIQELKKQSSEMTTRALSLMMLKKIEELEEDHAEGAIIHVPRDGYIGVYPGGLCLARLINSDDDNESELLVAYTNNDANKFFDSNEEGATEHAWTVELWDYTGKALEKVYSGILYSHHYKGTGIAYYLKDSEIYFVEGYHADNVNLQINRVHNNKEEKYRSLTGKVVYDDQPETSIDGKQVSVEDFSEELDRWTQSITLVKLWGTDDNESDMMTAIGSVAETKEELTKNIPEEPEDKQPEKKTKKSSSKKNSASSAMLTKIEELEQEHGTPEAAEDHRTLDGYNNYAFAKGLCAAKLINIDNDKDNELLVVYGGNDIKQYFNYESNTDHSIDKAWTVEVWDYRDGNLEKLYSGNPLVFFGQDPIGTVRCSYKLDKEILYITEGYIGSFEEELHVTQIKDGKAERIHEFKWDLVDNDAMIFESIIDGKPVEESTFGEEVNKWTDQMEQLTLFGYYTGYYTGYGDEFETDVSVIEKTIKSVEETKQILKE